MHVPDHLAPKLDALRRLAAELTASSRPPIEHASELENEVITLKNQREALTAKCRKGEVKVNTPEWDQLLEVSNSIDFRIAEAEKEREELIKTSISRSDHGSEATQVFNACRGWLSSLPNNTNLTSVHTSIPPGKPQDALVEVRAKMAEIAEKVRGMKAMPVATEDLERLVREFVAYQARSLPLQVRATGTAERLHVNWAAMPGSVQDRPPVLPLVASLFPDRLARLLLDTAQAGGGGGGGGFRSRAERAQDLLEAEQALDRLGRQEEALVVALLREGTAAYRRRHALPEHVLAVRVDGVVAAPPPAPVVRAEEAMELVGAA